MSKTIDFGQVFVGDRIRATQKETLGITFTSEGVVGYIGLDAIYNEDGSAAIAFRGDKIELINRPRVAPPTHHIATIRIFKIVKWGKQYANPMGWPAFMNTSGNWIILTEDGKVASDDKINSVIAPEVIDEWQFIQ